ncbi:MAG: tetratricopeptide repeat protein, partial [Phycisphaerales bacterium]|nr:tetratricopeptide repeat protein [Phycisphaerales bacterium]
MTHRRSSFLVMPCALMLCGTVAAQAQADLPALTVGETIEAVINDGDPQVHAPGLDRNGPDKPVVGKSFTLRVNEGGVYHIDLHAPLFDSYLILRGADGSVIAEDDDGLIATDSRLQVTLDPAITYTVDACALPRERGAFSLSCTPGPAPELTPEQRRAADVADAEARVAAAERAYGTEDPRTADALNNSAMPYYRMGDYGSARTALERALAIKEQVRGPEHPDVALGLNNLAYILYVMGDYESARPLHERALAIREKTLGPNHADTAQSLNNLALLVNAMGDYNSAKPLYERALSIRQQTFGPEHPRTADGLNNLAALLFKMGDYESARPLYERALAIREKALGPEHPSTATSLNNLALLLKNMDGYEQARPLLERALAIDEMVHGPDHPQTSTSLSNLALLLKDMGDYESARPLYERALAIDEKALGPEHSGTALDLNNLALLHQAMGDQEAALPLLERVLEIWEKALGPEHARTATCLNNLAVLLKDMRDYESALPLQERSLAIREKTLGPEHPETAESLNNLASLHHLMGNYVAAKPLAERSLAIIERSYGPEHPRTATCLSNVTMLQVDLGERNDAWNLATRAVSGRADAIRRTLSSQSERERFAFLALSRDGLENVLAISALIDDNPAIAAQAYDALLAWQGLAARTMTDNRDRLRASLSSEQMASIDELRTVQAQVSKLVYEQKPSEERDAKLAALRERRNQIEVELNRSLSVSGAADDDVTFAQLAAALPDDCATIDFFIEKQYIPAQWNGEMLAEKGKWTAPHVQVWITRKDNTAPIRIDLGDAAPIEAAVKTFLTELVSTRGIKRIDTSGAHNTP